MEVTINKLDGVGVSRYNERRSEVYIDDYFLGIIKDRAICRSCNMWSARLFIPNKKGGYALDRKDIVGSIKRIAEKLRINETA